MYSPHIKRYFCFFDSRSLGLLVRLTNEFAHFFVGKTWDWKKRNENSREDDDEQQQKTHERSSSLVLVANDMSPIPPIQ